MGKQSLTQQFLLILSNNLQKNRDYSVQLNVQADKIIVWMVGFSIGSIALIINSYGRDNILINNISPYILVFGFLTIGLGVIHRVFQYIAQLLESTTLHGFEMFVEGYNGELDIPKKRDISNKDTYEDIINYIDEDYSIKIQKVDTTILPPGTEQVLRNGVIEYYNKLNNLYEDIFNLNINEIKKILIEQLGYSKKRVDRLFDGKSTINAPKAYHITKKVASLFFILSLLAFLAGLVIIFIMTFQFFISK